MPVKQDKPSLLYRVGKGVILALSLTALLDMTLCLLLHYGYMQMSITEALEFRTPSLAMYAAALLLPAALYLLRPVLKRAPEKALFLGLLGCYLAAGVALILCTDPMPRTDQYEVLSIAAHLKNGDFSDFEPDRYLMANPHQLGLAVYEMLLMHISDSPRFLQFVNLAWVLLTLWLLWQTSRLLRTDDLERKYSLVFLFLFLPQLFFVLMLYGEVPGAMLVALSLYWACLGWKTRRWGWWLGSCVALGLACLVRNNFLIAAIALVVLTLLLVLKERQWRALLLALGMAVCAAGTPKAVNGYYAEKTGVDLSQQGIPMTAYITMGLQTNNTGKVDGWYNGYNQRIWRDYGYDGDAVAEQAALDLEERLEEMAADPAETFAFFHSKATSMWCDPLFESLWSGPLEDYGQYTYGKLAQNLYQGGKAYTALYTFMYAVVLLSYAMVLLEGVRSRGGNPWMLFGLLYFLGAFLFHLVWEASGQYVCVNLPFLMPMAGWGFARASRWVAARTERR